MAVLETIAEQDLVANADATGKRLLTPASRRSWPRSRGSATFAGPGLMIGVEFVKDRETREPDGATADAVLAKAADDGLILLSAGVAHQVVRWMPPIDVTPDEIDRALEHLLGRGAGDPDVGELTADAARPFVPARRRSLVGAIAHSNLRSERPTATRHRRGR